MRRKERHGAGTLSNEMADVIASAQAGDLAHIGTVARSKATIGMHTWPDEQLWAYDAVIFSVGCTHKAPARPILCDPMPTST